MKILLVQTSFLGDTILSTPLIAALNKLYPHSEIWMMTTRISAELVKSDPLLKGVIVFDKSKTQKGIAGMLSMARELKRHKFDVAYALHRSYRTAILLFLSAIKERVGFKEAGFSCFYTRTVKREKEKHDVIRNLSLLKKETAVLESNLSFENFFSDDLRLFVNNEQEVKKQYNSVFADGAAYAVLVPGSAWKTKMWFWQGYRQVAEYLLSSDKRVVFLGSQSESDLCQKVAQGLDVINLAGQSSINESMVILKNADLVVCNDSMSLHLASAFKVPNVSIFCATSPDFGFGPWKNKALVVEKKGLSCKPCRRHGSNKCPTGTEACMKELPAEEVIEAVKKLSRLESLRVIS